MIIWIGIILAGLLALTIGLFHLVVGIRKKNKKRIIYSVAVPIALWLGIALLLELDRRYIEEETKKNGGEPPTWVW